MLIFCLRTHFYSWLKWWLLKVKDRQTNSPRPKNYPDVCLQKDANNNNNMSAMEINNFYELYITIHFIID